MIKKRKKNRNRREKKLQARLTSGCTIRMLCCRGNKLFFFLISSRGKEVTSLLNLPRLLSCCRVCANNNMFAVVAFPNGRLFVFNPSVDL